MSSVSVSLHIIWFVMWRSWWYTENVKSILLSSPKTAKCFGASCDIPIRLYDTHLKIMFSPRTFVRFRGQIRQLRLLKWKLRKVIALIAWPCYTLDSLLGHQPLISSNWNKMHVWLTRAYLTVVSLVPLTQKVEKSSIFFLWYYHSVNKSIYNTYIIAPNKHQKTLLRKAFPT